MRAYPETLAIRTINQYRKRDIIAYIGLRLYLDNRCAVRDRWAKEVATELTRDEDVCCYHTAKHYKERTKAGDFEYRDLDIPLPSEMLAEAALLDCCAMAGKQFGKGPSVFSYRLAQKHDRSGVFVPYFEGYRERHFAIASACKTHPDGIVVFTDIRKYYPSLSTKLVNDAWKRCSTDACLPAWARELGDKLIKKQDMARGPHGGILTGPMFSHLLANLVFLEVDSEMSAILPGGYFRYVDDVALVGDAESVATAETRLYELISALGLSPNHDKRLPVTTKDWLEGETDLDDDNHPASWKSFVGGLKQILVLRPYYGDWLKRELTSAGFRIDLVSYSSEVYEGDYLAKLRRLANFKRIWRKIRMKDVATVVAVGVNLRIRYMQLAHEALAGLPELTGYERKRRLQKLRLYLARLVYLAESSELGKLAVTFGRIPELELFSVIFEAIDSLDVSRLVNYGAGAAQAVAQPLRALGRSVKCSVTQWTEASLQARAVLCAYGIQLDEQNSSCLPWHPMNVFCEWTEARALLFADPESFYGRLALLQGNTDERRLTDLLSQAFDEDEPLAFEMENLVLESS